MQYLCNKHGLERFYPTDPARARDGGQRDVLRDRDALSVHRARDVPDAALPAVRGRGRRIRRDDDAKAQAAAGRDRSVAQPLDAFRAFFLDGKRFIGGDSPSIADIRFAASLEFLRAIDYDVPGVGRGVPVRGRVGARRRVQRAGVGRARVHRERQARGRRRVVARFRSALVGVRAGARYVHRQHCRRGSELGRKLRREASAVGLLGPDDHGRPGSREGDADRFGRERPDAFEERCTSRSERLVQAVSERVSQQLASPAATAAPSSIAAPALTAASACATVSGRAVRDAAVDVRSDGTTAIAAAGMSSAMRRTRGPPSRHATQTPPPSTAARLSMCDSRRSPSARSSSTASVCPPAVDPATRPSPIAAALEPRPRSRGIAFVNRNRTICPLPMAVRSKAVASVLPQTVR